IFHDAIESASENFIENHIDSQKDYDKSDVDHNDSEEKDHLVDKLIRKFNKKIVKCQKRIEKANQQSKDFENQNKDLRDKYHVLKNQATTFEMNNKELNEQLKEFIEKNNDLLAQTNVLKEQLQVKHVVIDTHAECQENMQNLRLKDMIELDKHVRDLKNTVLEKDFKIYELKECVRNKDLEIENCLERLNVCENKLHKMGQTNQTVHMIMPSKDNLYNGRKGIGFENSSYFEKAKDLRPTLYDEKVIGLGRQDTMGDTSAHTRYERVSKMSSDSLLEGVNTPRSDEDRLKHIELMKICTTLQKKVLDLEDELKRIKTSQQTKIDGLERRVKKLEKKHRSRTHKLKRLYKVGLTAKVISSSDDEALDKEDTSKQERINEIDADKYIALVSTHDDVSTQDNIVQDKGIEDVGEEKVVEVVTNAKMIVDAAQVTTTIADILVSAAKTIVTTALTITAESTKTNVKDKGKGKTKPIEEPETPKKRKHQIRVDKELAEKIDADAQLAQRLHEEEQLQLTDAEKAKLFMEFIKKRRKFFAAKRDEEKRNKPLTKAQQMSILSTYLKNIDRWKIKSLKKKSFAEIQELFDKAMKRINTFIDFKIELVEESSKKSKAEITQEGSLKRTGDDPKQERSKKQKVEDDKESEELNKCLEIIPDDGDDVNIDATPLSSKSPIIVDYKMLKIFDREDLEVLWRLVKARFEKVQPVDNMDSFLQHNLKTVFAHHVKDNVWKNQQGLTKLKN
nr:hypothetical protein [Tanacetum cinerariifolium]